MTIFLGLFSFEPGSKTLEKNLKNWEIDPVYKAAKDVILRRILF